MSLYLKSQRRLRGLGHVDSSTETPIDPATLAAKQRVIFDRTIQTYQRILDGEDVEPSYLNIDGTAGCGKTYLIRAICQRLRSMAKSKGMRDPVCVMAPSGVAALNIGG